jgi:hypothetical protein
LSGAAAVANWRPRVRPHVKRLRAVHLVIVPM